MKSYFLLTLCFLFPGMLRTSVSGSDSLKFYSAAHHFIQYTGRFDFKNPERPRCWAAGAYIAFKFKGSACDVLLNDQVADEKTHNYVSVVIDRKAPLRMKLDKKTNRITVAYQLADEIHTVLICKLTESGNGYLEIAGIRCQTLLRPDPKPERKIEFIGNSITCGTGMDESVIPCGKGEWYDQHNAYMSYGALTARSLNAQWHLSSLSGVGLIHSCCKINFGMPEAFDKMAMRQDSLVWDFKNYIPDVVSICLGQNDGIQDSTFFCDAYRMFIKKIRQIYPRAFIICLSSPMADEKLLTSMKKNLPAVVSRIRRDGDPNVSFFFFSRRFSKGCGGHPDLAEHGKIAEELSAYIGKLKNW